MNFTIPIGQTRHVGPYDLTFLDQDGDKNADTVSAVETGSHPNLSISMNMKSKIMTVSNPEADDQYAMFSVDNNGMIKLLEQHGDLKIESGATDEESNFSAGGVPQ